MRIVDWWIDYYPLVTSNSIEQHRYSRSREAKYDYAIVSREEWTQIYCDAPCFVVIIIAFLFRPGLLWTSSNIPWSLSRASISKCIAFTAFFRTSYMLHVIHSYNVGHETNSVLSLKYILKIDWNALSPLLILHLCVWFRLGFLMLCRSSFCWLFRF